MKYLSLFSGIGGFELGIQQAYEKMGQNESLLGRPQDSRNTKSKWCRPKCVGYSEIDKYAIQIYEKNFNNKSTDEVSRQTEPNEDMSQVQQRKTIPEVLRSERWVGDADKGRRSVLPSDNGGIGTIHNTSKHKNYGDITKINAKELPEYDLLVGGFPCQSFSIAGRRRGFDDTRGTLFFDIARILKENKPRYFLLENVKGLLSHDSGRTFKIIIATLNELGYDVQWQVLNSKNFGVPQNRERVFIIGHLRGTPRPKVFPITQSSQGNLKYSGGVVSAREQWLKDGKHNSRNFSQGQRIYDIDGISQTLAGNAGGQGGKTGLYAIDYRNKRKHKISPTLLGNDHNVHPMVGDSTKIRRLTPIECERLQGFPDGWTEHGTQGKISDTQRYKVLGNAVTVNVIKEIVRCL